MFQTPLSRKQKLLVYLPLIIVAVKVPKLWPVLAVVVAALLVIRIVPPYLRQTASWTATAVLVTGAVLMLGGLILGLLSAFAGLGWHASVPWGLIWETSGRRSDGFAVELGNGFMLTPLFAGLIVALAWFPFARKTSRL